MKIRATPAAGRKRCAQSSQSPLVATPLCRRFAECADTIRNLPAISVMHIGGHGGRFSARLHRPQPLMINPCKDMGWSLLRSMSLRPHPRPAWSPHALSSVFSRNSPPAGGDLTPWRRNLRPIGKGSLQRAEQRCPLAVRPPAGGGLGAWVSCPCRSHSQDGRATIMPPLCRSPTHGRPELVPEATTAGPTSDESPHLDPKKRR